MTPSLPPHTTAGTPPYVFVSYSRWDRRSNKTIDGVLRKLREAGVRLWLAPDSVPAGADWQHTIEDAQLHASAHLAFFSARLKKATGMRRELGRAIEAGLPLVIALLDPLEDLPAEYLSKAVMDAVPILAYGEPEAAAARIVQRLPADVIDDQAAPRRPAPRSKGYVFLSYAQEDTEFIIHLRKFMQERGYGYWDYQDSDRNYHTQLYVELEEVIRNATATLSILSPDWKKSQWTVKEFLFSAEVETPVFLLMARDMGPTLVTAGIPYIDFADPERGFTSLERALRLKGLIE